MKVNRNLEDAFDSMLRADYISLGDTEKLQLLGEYYVDYFRYLTGILSQTDQLIVGRRGTGKTTLMYRALVECMRSWNGKEDSIARARTLGIYVDLSKCQPIYDIDLEDSKEFEHIFVTEICEAITSEITRSWPDVQNEPGLFTKTFRSAEAKQIKLVQEQLRKLSDILVKGVPRLAVQSGPIKKKDRIEKTQTSEYKMGGSAKADVLSRSNLGVNASAEANSQKTLSTSEESECELEVVYRLTVQDIIKILGELRVQAKISAIFIFIDEFSSLGDQLQRRFTSLLRKILGNHAGVYIKLGAITDNYTLGSSIILQRDLFEISLDLDSYISRSASLQEAMDGLRSQVEQIVAERLKAYANLGIDDVFEDRESILTELSRAAMGVPRTLGIILKQAYHRSTTDNRIKIRKTDIEFGIKYASQAYERHLQGASRDGIAIPSYIEDIYNAIISRASQEAAKSEAQASHFMVLPENEPKLKYLNMFFLVHLLTRGRTTKKDRTGRSLYCIDYGICLEHNLGFAEHKNVIRQQRFAYDDILVPFDRYFSRHEDQYKCPVCKKLYSENELYVAGSELRFCINDKADLIKVTSGDPNNNYTEEEIKILGAIRSATKEDKLIASKIADDVGCYRQKVARFGEKLQRRDLIMREKDEGLNVFIYYGVD
jgi:hypothetical protein